MSAKDRLLNRVGSILEKTAAPILWKYVDQEGLVFYLSERVRGTIHSPFSGRTFTSKPVRQSLTDISKELRSGDAKIKGALWRYVDSEGNEFYCDQRLVGTVRSPLTGATFPAKPEKFTLNEVGQELKLEKSSNPELQEMQGLLTAKGYAPELAAKLQDEGMGPSELAERLKDPAQFELNYNAPKLASTVTAALSPMDKKVIDAFFDHKPLEGRMVSTDGKTLDKNGLGGSNFAKWDDGKIVVDESRPQVTSDQEILRYMKKSIPAKMLAPHIWFRKSSEQQVAIATEFVEKKASHDAITVIRESYERIGAALESCKSASDVMHHLYPAVKRLGDECTMIASQLQERLGE